MVKGWLEVSATPVEEGGREGGEMRESLLVSHSKGVSRVREGEREGDRGMRYIHRKEGDREREQGEENRSLHASICMAA